MLDADLEWWTLVDGMSLGDHVLFWRDGSETSTTVIEAFLRSAIARNELAAVVLPWAEWTALAKRLREDRVAVDRLLDDGHLVLLSSNSLFSPEAPPADQVRTVLDELVASARHAGYAGLSLLGAIASAPFVAGDQAIASAIESAIHDRRRSARVLCVYDSLELYPLRIPDAYALARLHTHTLTAVARGKIVAEAVAPKPVPHVPSVSRDIRGTTTRA